MLSFCLFLKFVQKLKPLHDIYFIVVLLKAWCIELVLQLLCLTLCHYRHDPDLVNVVHSPTAVWATAVVLQLSTKLNPRSSNGWPFVISIHI